MKHRRLMLLLVVLTLLIAAVACSSASTPPPTSTIPATLFPTQPSGQPTLILPTPGTPSISRWPRARMGTSARRMMSSFPRMTVRRAFSSRVARWVAVAVAVSGDIPSILLCSEIRSSARIDCGRVRKSLDRSYLPSASFSLRPSPGNECDDFACAAFCSTFSG